MSFKHIDPGYGIGFDESDPHRGTVYNPQNGIAFCSYWEYRDCTIKLTEPETALTDLWIKFDIFLTETATTAITSIKSANSNYLNYPKLIRIEQEGSNFSLQVLDDSSLVLEDDATNLRAGAVNTIWLHAQNQSAAWSITVMVNDNRVFDNVSSSRADTIRSTLKFSISPQQPISNLIISDEEVSPKETIIEVGNSGVETTMTENNGAYSSGQAGDYVLQTLDTTALYGLFGSDGKVTGMVAVAAPAYTTGSDVTQIKCRKVDGTTTTDYTIYDSIGDIEHLIEMTEEEFADLDSSDWVLFIGKQLDVASDTTFADLNGLKVGWVTA